MGILWVSLKARVAAATAGALGGVGRSSAAHIRQSQRHRPPHPDANRALTPYPVPPTRPHRRPLTRMRHCAMRSRRLSRRHEPLTALAEWLLRRG